MSITFRFTYTTGASGKIVTKIFVGDKYFCSAHGKITKAEQLIKADTFDHASKLGTLDTSGDDVYRRYNRRRVFRERT